MSLVIVTKHTNVHVQVIDIPKHCAEDTVLVASNASGEKKTIPIAGGTSIAIHTPGLHYNR
jgi:hypothetical protein